MIRIAEHNLYLTPVDECPHCHHKMVPKFQSYHLTSVDEEYSSNVYAVFRCVNINCNKIFVALYGLNTGQGNTIFKRYLDGSPIHPEWPDIIKSLNSKFIDTYLQCLKAEQQGLVEIAGMGYRKALEYLIKDYLIYRYPDKKEWVENEYLSTLIEKSFVSPEEKGLKEILVSANWLGNDFSHYVRYHEDFDITDLKQLIEFIIADLDSMDKRKKYSEGIANKQKNKN